jgi:2-keto-4-pentenoate hydratase/2-oxohepta-3-ene-1,7-dioic acid hydratase in catechol pathway
MTATRFVRVMHEGVPRYGVIDGTEVALIEPHPFVPFRATGDRLPIEGLRLLAPVIPSKIVCVGKNYRDHAAELGGEVPTEPLYFLKPSSSVIGPGEPIRLPTDLSDEVHHEAELAVVVGALLQRVTPEEAWPGCSATPARTTSRPATSSAASRSGSAPRGSTRSVPLGPAVATGLDPADLRVRCLVDGELRQDGTTADLVWDVAHAAERDLAGRDAPPERRGPDRHAGRRRPAPAGPAGPGRDRRHRRAREPGRRPAGPGRSRAGERARQRRDPVGRQLSCQTATLSAVA